MSDQDQVDSREWALDGMARLREMLVRDRDALGPEADDLIERIDRIERTEEPKK